MNKKIIIGITVVAIVVVGVFMFLNLRIEPSEEMIDGGVEENGERVLYIVTSPWKPYMYEEDGEYKGIDVEVMDRVFNNLGIEYKFEIFPWPRAYKMGEEGIADGFLHAAYKVEREPVIRFTDAQRTMLDEINSGGDPSKAYLSLSMDSFFIKKMFEGSLEYESPEQIAESGLRIGVNKDYAYVPEVWKSGWNLVEHITEQESFEALMDGKIDMFVCNKVVCLFTLKEMGLSDEVVFLEKQIAVTPGFLVFTKASDYPNLDEVIKQVDEELIRIHESGEYDKIYGRYIS